MNIRHHIPTNTKGKPNINFGFPPLRILGEKEIAIAEKTRNDFYAKKLLQCNTRKEKKALRKWIMALPAAFWLSAGNTVNDQIGTKE